MFMRRKRKESYRETRSSEWGNFSADIRRGSSAEFPGATHRLGSLPAASWSLTSKRHHCVKTHPILSLISTGVWSLIPLGPDLLLTLFRGTLKWKKAASLRNLLLKSLPGSSLLGVSPPAHPAPPVSICIGLFGAASFTVISITKYAEILSSVSSNCVLKTLFSIFLSVVSDVQGHLELAAMWGTAWG